MKKLTCTLLTLLLLASCLVLPGAGAEELPYYEIDVLSQNSNFAGIQSGWFGKLILDKFNIALNITATNLEGGASKLATKMATGDLGELLNFGSVTSPGLPGRPGHGPAVRHEPGRLPEGERALHQRAICPT